MSFSEIMSRKYGQVANVQYLKPDKNKNQAKLYTKDLVVSNYDLLNSNFDNVLKNCIYIPNYVCEKVDKNLFEQLLSELNENDVVKWSKHHKYENSTFSPTFNGIIEKLSKDFNVDVKCTRLNYYKNGNDYKPFHRDSHVKDENFTLGCSLGSSRILSFMHEESRKKFHFEQNNGDIFAFDDIVNRDFLHGVPKSRNSGERISIIMWGVKK